MVSAKASVMVYSDTEKKWLPGGSSSGISKVCIYHHPGNNTFRVVGRKLQDMEVSYRIWYQSVLVQATACEVSSLK